MPVLKSAFRAALDRYFQSVSKEKFSDVLANAAITVTQFYARERLAKNLLESRAARRASRFGHNGIIKGNPVGLMTTASIPTSIGINKEDAILRHKMSKIANAIPPINFYPPAVVQSKALLPKALRGMFSDSPSGVLDTDQIASDNILEEKLKRLDSIRTFGRATKASGFSRYARAERESNERIDRERELEAEELHRRRMSDKSFEFEMLDKDEQFIQGAMRDRGWSRDQAEQVYFKNLTENTKWLRLIGKNNPKIAKNLMPIAKAVGKASGLPIIGAFARNPAIGAITALIGGGLSAGSYSLGRSGTLSKWMNARAVTGDIDPGTFHGLAAAGMSYEQMLQSLFKYSVKSSEARFGGGFDKYAKLAKYGVDVSGLFNPYLTAEERRAEEYRVVSSANQADRAAIMATLGMSPEEFRSEKLRHTPRSKWSLSDLQLDIYRGTTQRMKENHPFLDFFIPNKLYEFHSLLAANKELEDRKFLGDSAVDYRREIYNLHKWNEVRETANVDDQYRAGMFDNSVTNNETDNGKSLTVINNWGGVSVEAKDTADFVDNLESTVGSKIIGSRYIAEAFDTMRIK